MGAISFVPLTYKITLLWIKAQHSICHLPFANYRLSPVEESTPLRHSTDNTPLSTDPKPPNTVHTAGPLQAQGPRAPPPIDGASVHYKRTPPPRLMGNYGL